MSNRLTSTILSDLWQLKTAIHEHGLEMANLRAALESQIKQTAQIQAELDRLPARRERRSTRMQVSGTARNNDRTDC